MQGGVNLGVRETYADISATVLDFLGLTIRCTEHPSLQR